jgi:hypothetical protein
MYANCFRWTQSTQLWTRKLLEQTDPQTARAVCEVHAALDLYTHLKSLEVHADGVEEEQNEEEQEDRKRYPFSYLSRLLYAGASTPLLLFDPELTARKNAPFQEARRARHWL